MLILTIIASLSHPGYIEFCSIFQPADSDLIKTEAVVDCVYIQNNLLYDHMIKNNQKFEARYEISSPPEATQLSSPASFLSSKHTDDPHSGFPCGCN